MTEVGIRRVALGVLLAVAASFVVLHFGLARGARFVPDDLCQRANVAANAAPEDFLAALDALIEHAKSHFDLENGWMEAVDFPGCHRAEHDRVLAVMADIRKRVERGDHFLGRRLMEELPAWFVNHVNGMDAALAFHLATIGFDVDACTLRPLSEGETRAAGCGCAALAAEDAAAGEAARTA